MTPLSASDAVAGSARRPTQAAAAPSNRKRGSLRPETLATPRARMEAAQTERVYRAAEMAAVLVIAFIVCQALNPQGILAAPMGEVLPFALGAAVMAYALASARAYSLAGRDALRHSLARAAAALLVSAMAVGLLILALPLPARIAHGVSLWFVLSTAAVLGLHILWWARVQQLRRAGKLIPNIVIVGATANAEGLIASARQTGDVAVLGIFDDRIGRVPDEIDGVAVLGDTAALLDHRIMPYVDRIVITVPSQAQGRVRELIERLRVLPNEVSLLLDVDGAIEPSAAVSRIAASPLAQVSGNRIDETQLFAKRLQDLVVGTLALVVAAPVMVGVAIAVKLDSPGPVFFRQRRHGFNNEEIMVWKFRSMRHDRADATASRQVSADDDRVTRVGRFIRMTSLDELPQLLNVLRGDMSLVGPRPHAIGMRSGDQESARLVAEYAHRHRMKPGVTGWAAIKGSRGPVDTAADVRRRVALDVEYIERHSVWMDLYILAMTIPCLLGDSDAVR